MTAMNVVISPTLMLMTILELLAIPITILVLGFILFYFKRKYRKVIGIVFIALGALDLLLVLFRYPYFMINYPAFIDILTVLLGIVSIFYSSKYGKK